MIDQLRREVDELERLSPTEQEEMALYIHALLHAKREMHEQHVEGASSTPGESWQDPAGALSHLVDAEGFEDEFEAFHRMRHEVPPSAPIEP